MSQDNLKKRNAKTNGEQLESLLNFLVINKQWLTNSRKTLEEESEWANLCQNLNCVSKGARKTNEEWKNL